MDAIIFLMFMAIVCEWKWFPEAVAKFILRVKNYMEEHKDDEDVYP